MSSVGSGLTAFALGVYVYQTTKSATYVSLVALFAFFPTIILSPIGGVLSDHFDRRLTMIIGDSASALGLVYILICMLRGNISIWQICLGVMISAVFCALTETAYKASITDLLTEDEFAKASGLVQIANSSKYLLSPIIAGFLLVITDVTFILILDICTFFVTVLTVAFVRKNLKVKADNKKALHLLKDLKEGWENVSSNKGIVYLILLLSLVTFYMGFLQTLYTPMLLGLTDVKTLGIIETVSAVGLLIGSLFIGTFNIKKNYTYILTIGLAFSGVFFSLIGSTKNILFITGAGFIFFAALPFVNMSADILIRKNIDNEYQGRAWGIIGIISQLGYVGAYMMAGFLADYIFNPLLEKNGLLAPTIGKIIGVGEGRGIGLLFIISGILIVMIAFILSKTKAISALE